jgi:two-component system, LytTR family, response regulator
MSTPPLRVVVADDEPLARQRVRSMLAGREGFEIVADATNGAEAVELIVREQPDLVFLDVKMPELDGFEVISALEEATFEEAPGDSAAQPDRALPAIVFVTAFSDYAVKAFEVRALDYLLKPFDRARFDRVLDAALARASQRSAQPPSTMPVELKEALAELSGHRRYPARFLVRTGSRMYFVHSNDVEWADAAANYVRLHAGGRAHLIRRTMTSLEKELNPDRFVRVHRSAIINIDCVSQIEPHVHGEYVITMRDGTRLTSSRAHHARLRALLERSG